MLKLLRLKIDNIVQRLLEKYYNYYKDDLNVDNYEDLVFLIFLDSVLKICYFLFFIFASVSGYFFVTREILPLFWSF